MRVIEVGMRAMASDLAIPDPIGGDRNWHNMIEKISKAVAAKKTADPTWASTHHQLYLDAIVDLTAIKTAWRNPVMHVEGVYVEEWAIHIMNVTKGFMRHLCRWL